MRRGVRALLLTFAALIQAGCSGGTAEAPLQLQALAASQQIIKARLAGPKAARPPLRRADLDPLEGSFLEVTLERRDQLAYLSVNATRHDDLPGKITVWRTQDNVTLAMRNGVLIATRGLGGDILSSLVQVQGTSPGPSGGGEHVQMIRSLDAQEVRLSLVCELVDLGPSTIVIVERNHLTRHLQQRCSGGGGDVVNDYWVDERAGLVWQSRQWAGPNIGYMRFRRLTH